MKNNNENNENKRNFGIDTTDYTFVSLRELPTHKIISVNGLFIYKGKYGLTPVVINKVGEILISLPTHRTKRVTEILNDEQMIASIQQGEICLVIDEYEKNGNTYKTCRFRNKQYLKKEEIQKSRDKLMEYENIIRIAKELKAEKAKSEATTTEQNTETTEDLPF